jgi:hypothetical protein
MEGTVEDLLHGSAIHVGTMCIDSGQSPVPPFERAT